MKLVTKINLVVGIGAMLGMSVIVFFVALRTRIALQNSIGERQLDQTITIFDHIDEELFERSRDIKTLSFNSFVRNSINNPAFNSLDLKKELQNFAGNGGSWWRALTLINKNGKIVASYGSGLESLKDISTEPIIEKAYLNSKTGKAFFSDAVELSDKTPTIIFASPILDTSQSNEVIGVIIGELSWSELLQILEQEQGVLIHLYKHDGTVIGSNDKGHQTGIFTINHGNTNIFKQVLLKSSISTVSLSVHGDFNSLATGVIEKGYDGFTGNGWVLLSETPTNVAFSSVYAITNELIVLIIIFTILFLFLLIIMSRHFVLKPLANLQLAAEAFSQGNLKFRLDVRNKDEFGKLSELFNNMAEKLMRSYQNLEGKVAEKTKELNSKLIEVQKANINLDNARKAIVNVTEDISLEKEKIEESKVKEDAILDSIGEGMFVSDNDGKVILVNDLFEKLTGWKSKEILGKRFVDLVPLLDANEKIIAPEKRPLMITSKTGKPTTISIEHNYLCVRKNGTKFPIAIKNSPVFLNRKIIGVVNVFRDVTREKEVDRMKTEFLSVAAHQLRTPLGSMRWDLEMLLNGDFGKLQNPLKVPVEQILSRNLHMISLVNDLLNVSRIDQGKVIDEPKLTDTGAIVKNVAGDMKPFCNQKTITMNLTIGKNDKTYIDPKKFHQVIENLLINSINYSYRGGKVDVDLHQTDGYIKVDIKDSGIGIPEDAKHRIFTKFFRAENALKSETDGTGLGLYVVKSYINKWKGKIWYESKVGKGTTFHFTIPIIKAKKQ